MKISNQIKSSSYGYRLLKTKGSSINHKSYLKSRGFKKPLTSLIFILLILTSLSAGNALADTSAASPSPAENGSNITAPQNSPESEELENAVKEAADSGKIKITTIPNGSEIYIEDIYRGTTPARLTDVPPGFYRVVLKQEGYDDVFERVLMKAGETYVISKKLSFKEGVCSISSEPGGARVYLDGKYKGITPVAFHADEGTHSLKIKKTGYGTVSKEVNVSYDEPFVLKEELHLSSLVYLAAVQILLVGGVFVKKKPEIPGFKIPDGSGFLKKYEKKSWTAVKREKKEKEEEEEEEEEEEKEEVWGTSASREKESPKQEERGAEAEAEVEMEEGAESKAKVETEAKREVETEAKREVETEVEGESEAEPLKLVELEKMPEPEFRYTVKKKEDD